MNRDWLEKDYYKALGVSENASSSEIKKQYRKLAHELHPDKAPGMEERFKEISEAYDVIGSEHKRKEYDEARSLLTNPSARFFTQGTGEQDYNRIFEDIFANEDMSDLLGGLFGGRGGSSRTSRKGSDIESSLEITFKESYEGATKTLTMQAQTACPTCSGRGMLQQQNKTVTCVECNGKGSILFTQTITTRIPAGVKDGAKIKLSGKGAPSPAGAGDLYLSVKVQPHRIYHRKNNDMTLVLPVTFPEMVLGAEVEVPLITGGTIKMKIPEGSTSGRVLRIKNKGFSYGNKTGDLLVVLEVAVPQNTSREIKNLVKEYQKKTKDHDPRRDFMRLAKEDK